MEDGGWGMEDGRWKMEEVEREGTAEKGTGSAPSREKTIERENAGKQCGLHLR